MSEIYYPNFNSEQFVSLIVSTISRAKIKKKYLDILTQKNNLELYKNAFTASSADSVNNYEIFEQLGDVTANKFIVWYSYKRFPQLFCPQGIKVVARLKINYGSKQTFYKIADQQLKFWPWIAASQKERDTRKKHLLEDVFEAFCGVTEFILDNETVQGVGNSIVYDILKNLFDNINISLKYEDLYDNKTRLKEFFDKNKNNLGTIKYLESPRAESDTFRIVRLFQVPNQQKRICNYCNQKINTQVSSESDIKRNGWVLLAEGKAPIKSDAEQNAAGFAIRNLKRQGIFKENDIVSFYKTLCN